MTESWASRAILSAEPRDHRRLLIRVLQARHSRGRNHRHHAAATACKPPRGKCTTGGQCRAARCNIRLYRDGVQMKNRKDGAILQLLPKRSWSSPWCLEFQAAACADELQPINAQTPHNLGTELGCILELMNFQTNTRQCDFLGTPAEDAIIDVLSPIFFNAPLPRQTSMASERTSRPIDLEASLTSQ